MLLLQPHALSDVHAERRLSQCRAEGSCTRPCASRGHRVPSCWPRTSVAGVSRRVIARHNSGEGASGSDEASSAPRAPVPAPTPRHSPTSPSSNVALALGLDPGELEPESRVGEEDLYEGIAGAGSPSALPSPLQPLLEAVTEEISFRWRTATEGKWSPSAAPAPRDVSCTPYVYLEKRLRRWDCEAYAAAGLLPYLCLNEGGAQAQAELGLALGGAEEVPRMELLSGGAGGASEPPCLPPAPLPPGAPPGLGASPLDGFYVLLARQGLAKRRKTLVARLLLLGGKRERADSSPLATALREAREETIGLLGARRVRPELLGPVLWFPQGRFALFLYNVPPSARDSLPTAFAQRLGSAGAVQGGVEVDALEWVPLVDVLARSRSHRRGIAPFARAVVSASPLLKFFVSLGADKLTEARNAADEGRR